MWPRTCSVPPPCNMGLNSLQSHARRSEVQVVFT
jgi:hypothetical protein